MKTVSFLRPRTAALFYRRTSAGAASGPARPRAGFRRARPPPFAGRRDTGSPRSRPSSSAAGRLRRSAAGRLRRRTSNWLKAHNQKRLRSGRRQSGEARVSSCGQPARGRGPRQDCHKDKSESVYGRSMTSIWLIDVIGQAAHGSNMTFGWPIVRHRNCGRDAHNAVLAAAGL